MTMDHNGYLNHILQRVQETDSNTVSVADGNLSNAVFYLQHGLVTGEESSLNRCSHIIDRHIGLIAEDISELRFGYGLSGFTWLLYALRKQGLYQELDLSDFDDIDEYIFNSAAKYLQKGVYNYLDGALGMGLYLLEKPASAQVSAYLAAMVNRLDELRVPFPGNSAGWLEHYTSRYDNVPRKSRPYFNLGIAHGITSIIYFLAKCYQAGISTDACRSLIRQAANWMVARETPQQAPFLFPNKVLDHNETYPPHLNNRFSWCNGMLGVAFGFYIAGRVLDDPSLVGRSLEVAKAGAAITLPQISSHMMLEKDIYDIYICHGMAGLAHMYHKLYGVHHEPVLKQAADYWLTNTLQYYEQYSGYNAKRTGVLNGLPGIGLILLDRLAPDNGQRRFSWDRILLTDIECF